MSNEQSETANHDTKPDVAAEATGSDATTAGNQRGLTSDDFLVPGPSAESNEGMLRWGCTWLAFSLLLILLMLGISFACLTLANWTGLA